MSDSLAIIITYTISIVILAVWYSFFWKLIKPNNKNLKQGVMDVGLVFICTCLSFEIALELLMVVLKMIVG